MTEATKRYIPEINAVDSFSPAEFTRELPSDDGTTSLYMDVKFRLLWFRLHRPNGKVEPELVSVDDKSAVVCCKIFNDRSDASDQFVAKSYAQRFRSDEKFGDRFLEVAETAAVGRALASAGYEELCRIYQGGEMNRPVREVKRKKCLVIASPELPIATSETRNNTYSNLLSLLSLSATHRESLLRRGLSGKDIDALGYRTTPAVRAKKIVTELLERGCDLKGVPGFYCDKETGRWMMDVRGSGIMLPIRSCAGEIESIQVRLDKVYDSKFYTFTSVDKYCGATAIGCPHFVGVKEGMESVYLTEGVMKSDIAHCVSGYLGQPRGFVGLTGVTKYSHFERALYELQTLGIKRINLAYDMDALENANVREAKERIISMGIDAGFDMIPLSWNAAYKGVDDLFVSMLQNRLKA